jgi:hypothetical protein
MVEHGRKRKLALRRFDTLRYFFFRNSFPFIAKSARYIIR